MLNRDFFRYTEPIQGTIQHAEQSVLFNFSDLSCTFKGTVKISESGKSVSIIGRYKQAKKIQFEEAFILFCK